MNYKRLTMVALCASLGYSCHALAETDLEKIERLEKEINALKEAYTAGSPERVERIAEQVSEDEEGDWTDRIEIGALLEFEAGYISPYEGDSESDLVIATFAPYIISQVNDWISLEGTLLYEEDDTDLEVDIATITIANPEKSDVYGILGQTYMPFGNYDTNLLSDPLTLEIGESRETGIQAGIATGSFNIGAYLFNGDLGESSVEDYGVVLGYEAEIDSGAFAVGAGYISNMGEADGLQDGITVSDGIDGVALYGTIEVGAVNFIAGYVGATEEFDPTDIGFNGVGAQPTAFNLEVGYTFESFGRESVIALGYQGTSEAVALELPKERFLLGYSINVLENTDLLFEYAHDTDYDIADGGTGKDANSVVAQLAVVF